MKRYQPMFLMIVSVLLVTAGCKRLGRAPGSKLNDVNAVVEGTDDQKTNAKPRRRTCGTGSLSAAPADALAATFSRLPARLQAQFPLQEGDSSAAGIQLVKEATELDKLCDAAVAKPNDPNGLKGGWRACYDVANKSDPERAYPIVYLLEDTGAIYENLVATVVFAYGAFWIDQLVPASLASMSDEKVQKAKVSLLKLYRDARSEVVQAMAPHFSAQKEVVQDYLIRFGVSDLKGLLNNEKFQNYVLGEVAEEYYCSSDPKRPLFTDTFRDVLDPFMTFALHFAIMPIANQ